MRRFLTLFLLSACAQCEQSPEPEAQPVTVNHAVTGPREARLADLRGAMTALEPLQRALPKPQAGDWLAEHRESGQTLEEWLAEDELTIEAGRRNIVVQPIGPFTPAQRRVIDLTGTFLGLYFGLPVVVENTLPIETIPDRARRRHPSWDDEQMLTGHILHQVLVPRFPKDAAMVIGLTATDLWPGRGWNFVFGEALPRKRVAVWSIYRFGDPGKSAATYRRTLLRSTKVATHETGHMFGIDHCTAHECNMCGSNSLEEADRSPLWLCNECAAKVWWATGANPAERSERLAAFCRDNGLEEEERYYQRAAAALVR